MPIFDFSCVTCGDEQEKFVAIGELPDHCGLPMKKLISFKGSYVFKGDGFYSTEHGNQAHHLEPTQQAQRAARECKERGIVVATPGRTSLREIEKFQKNREAGSYY